MKRQRYLCKKIEEGEIEHLDPLEIQARITLLDQAPSIISQAIANGWISYPTKSKTAEQEELESKEWLKKYDCERAYRNRVKGMTYREIAKLLCVGIGKVSEIINHGETIAVKRKMAKLGIKPVELPTKDTVAKHTTTTKSKSNVKR